MPNTNFVIYSLTYSTNETLNLTASVAAMEMLVLFSSFGINMRSKQYMQKLVLLIPKYQFHSQRT